MNRLQVLGVLGLIGCRSAPLDIPTYATDAKFVADATKDTREAVDQAMECRKPRVWAPKKEFNPNWERIDINFEIYQNSFVIVFVKDIDGNVIRTILLGLLETGEYTYTWDGRILDDVNIPVKPGRYEVKVEAKTETCEQSGFVVVSATRH